MTPSEILASVKMALPIVTNAYDDEINELIAAAVMDLTTAGVMIPDTIDALVLTAIKTYCRMHFGAPANYDQLKASYDEQKAQLGMRTGYTVWTRTQ